MTSLYCLESLRSFHGLMFSVTETHATQTLMFSLPWVQSLPSSPCSWSLLPYAHLFPKCYSVMISGLDF